MKNFITIALFCIIAYTSCQSQDDNVLEFKKEICFPTGFWAGSSHSGVFYEDNEPYYYFAELTSRKIIKIFDKDSKLVKEISLKTQPYINMTHSIYMPCMDSVIVMIGRPVQKVLVTNSKGETLFEKYFQQFVRTDSINYALEAPMWLPSAYYNKNIYMISNAYKQTGDETPAGQYAEIRNIANRQPRICQINLQDSSLSPIYFGKNTLSKIYDNDTIEHDSWCEFHICNHYLFDVTHDYGKIAVFDLKTNTLVKVLEIKHNNKIAGIEQIKHGDLPYNKIYELSNKSWQIQTILWDQYKDSYYIFIAKSKKELVVQIFDKNLTFKKEIDISKLRGPGWIIDYYMTRDGLAIPSTDKKSSNICYKVYDINI